MQTHETIGEEVRERLGDMTPSERRVARALLATYPTAGLESLPQLAEAANVTGPTVLRFVRKIGYDGYPDFQRSLRLRGPGADGGSASLYGTRVTTQDDRWCAAASMRSLRALDDTFASTSLRTISPTWSRSSRTPSVTCGSWVAGSATARELSLPAAAELRPGCSMIGDTPDARVLDSLEVSRKTCCACSTTAGINPTRSRPAGSRPRRGAEVDRVHGPVALARRSSSRAACSSRTRIRRRRSIRCWEVRPRGADRREGRDRDGRGRPDAGRGAGGRGGGGLHEGPGRRDARRRRGRRHRVTDAADTERDAPWRRRSPSRCGTRAWPPSPWASSTRRRSSA